MRRKTARTAALAMVVGVALVAAACSSGSDHDHASTERADLVSHQLRSDMRELWEDHVTWTRVVIISAAADLPDFQAAVGRLLENQEDIGNAIKPYYGETAGTELTRLLKDHIAIAGDLLVAAKAGDTSAQEDASTRWYANADDIARFLAAANPDHWPEPEMAKMMRTHLDLTLEEATARLTGDWAGDVVAYDRVMAEIRHMADMLTDGIVAQFPERFS
ncbi:MAG: hypothetical protein M3179_02515 [Actinomycetota bacterium]|nr:hypothetical protein [Actinomycetota bacterium]